MATFFQSDASSKPRSARLRAQPRGAFACSSRVESLAERLSQTARLRRFTPFAPFAQLSHLTRLTPLSLALVSALVHAQTSNANSDASTTTGSTLAPVFVTANPLGDSDLISPATSVGGDDLTLRAANSLGETLNGLPGVSTTTYGPMVGRPIIRGMDGDRIRLLQNGVAAYDASSLSYDHAVPQDPLSIERVEIVRGPAALLYGGNAIGGVVNTIDNRIPREPIQGVTGAIDASYGGANDARAGAAQVEAGNGQFAFHVDAFDRDTSNQRIPGYAHSAAQRAADGGADEPYGSIPNSDGRWHGGAVGTSYTWADGYAGISYNGFQSDYGSVAEDDVRLRMHQDHVAVASEIRNLSGPFSQLKFDFGYTDYEHREIDNGEVGTTFRNHGYEARLEARHKKIGPLEGAIGVQVSQNTFSALGDEALVPTTQTTNIALFGLEEWQVTQRLKLSAGARLEHVKLDPTPNGNERFANAQGRDFNAGSVSAGALRVRDVARQRPRRCELIERADVLRALRERAARRDRPVSDRQSGCAEREGGLDGSVAALRARPQQGERGRVLQPLPQLSDRVQHGPPRRR